MSQRIFYEIDGRVHGPINLTQLQLMAASGMLQPQHRVKREGTDLWFPAQNVRGLFTDSTPAPAPAVPAGAMMPQPVAAAAASVPADEEVPFGAFGSVDAEGAPELNPAFDFFSDEPVAAPPKPARGAKPAKPAKTAPVPKTPEPQPLAKLDKGVPDSKSQPAESPVELPQADDLPVAEAIEEMPAAPKASAPVAAPAKPAEPKMEARPEAPAQPLAAAAEVSGRAVDIRPDDSLHLLDGKTSFRLHRSWLLATSKFADGTTRSTYLRLSRIDAAILDQRPSDNRGKSGPNSLLAFAAGNVRVGLVFQGSDKLYRMFLERVLLMGHAGSASKSSGKA